MNVNPNVSLKFWEKVDRTGMCWLWTGARINGFPVFRLNGRYQSAARLVCEGLPQNRNISKRCKNPDCINPAHFVVPKGRNAKIDGDDPWLSD